MPEMYPSTQELLPDLLLSRIPSSLVDTIEERYNRLGPTYLTDKKHTDNRLINACMFRDSIQDCLEEIVDSVFNILVLIYKGRQYEPRIDDNAWSVLTGLIEIYSLLQVMKSQENQEIVPLRPWGEVAPR